jgi:hypothetical protein
MCGAVRGRSTRNDIHFVARVALVLGFAAGRKRDASIFIECGAQRQLLRETLAQIGNHGAQLQVARMRDDVRPALNLQFGLRAKADHARVTLESDLQG